MDGTLGGFRTTVWCRTLCRFLPLDDDLDDGGGGCEEDTFRRSSEIFRGHIAVVLEKVMGEENGLVEVARNATAGVLKIKRLVATTMKSDAAAESRFILVVLSLTRSSSTDVMDIMVRRCECNQTRSLALFVPECILYLMSYR